MARAQGTPILVSPEKLQHPLERVNLGNGILDEDWLQQLIHDHPQALPMADIEPGFGQLVPAAREVPCGHGYIDNLYLTPAGDIVLVETKLWRNSQMRREVVAQALDYVAALASMTFDEFEQAVSKGLGAPRRLYELVAGHPEALGQAAFIDAVSRNLGRGRMLAIVLGDGIRSETEALTGLLQSHAGAHFTFALVELAVWRNTQTGDLLVIPATLARTVMIERGVVRIERGEVRIEALPQEVQQKAQSISMADFWAKMAERNPGLPAAIRALLAELEPLGVYPDLKASLNIKLDVPDRDKPVNFGYIQKNGQFWTNMVTSQVPEHLWRPYLECLAGLVGGVVAAESGGTHYVAVNGRSAPHIDQFLPVHHAEMVAAISRMARMLNNDRGVLREERA